jgi:glycosyltransferase involved in cell wall biosynthesis
MLLDAQPLVSVVTPVYNGEKYLAECIESVLAQTYQNWNYVIVNNRSTDRTLEIAQHFAQQDSRIRIHNNLEFLGLLQNFNNSLRQISPCSKYCKMVLADDWLFPDCLMEMVEVAETNPSVGLVGSYRLEGVKVGNNGLPYPSRVVPGREVCRMSLLGRRHVFGSPTSVLYRSDLVREREAFFNETNLHADREAAFDVLQNSDFGFVHQVLTFSRVHDETVTASFAKRINTYILGRVTALVKYGHVYLSDEEYEQRLKELMEEYYRILGNSVFERRDKKFWNYHRNGLKNIGIPLSSARVYKALLWQIIDALFNPKRTIDRMIAKTTQGGRKVGLYH